MPTELSGVMKTIYDEGYMMKVCQFGYKFVICGNMLTYTMQFGEYILHFQERQ